MRKQYPGHAKRVMFGIWSFLRQFMYTKFIIVVDDDINVRDWKEVIWAITTRVDPARDTLDRGEHADRLSRLRQPGVGPGLEDGHRRHQQVAGRDQRASGARRSRWTRRSKRAWTIVDDTRPKQDSRNALARGSRYRSMPNRLAQRDQPLSAAARGQPGGLVSVGRGGAAAGARAGQADPASVGYSACHWCHVMAHESFEDPEIAAVDEPHCS